MLKFISTNGEKRMRAYFAMAGVSAIFLGALLPNRARAGDKRGHSALKAAVLAGVNDGPLYTSDGRLKFPANYREWIFLTSGLDMSYNPKATAATHSTFDNVFVNPSAYREFLKTGTWPDKTMLVLEVRGGAGDVSINRRGRTQTTDIVGFEVHVKDVSKNPGGWAFYGFDNAVSAKRIDRPAACYTCHEAHGAVDSTFVQFYPTLMPIARQKKTLSVEFLKDVLNSPAK